MEFSQPRLSGAQGAKPTHDFLSLYSPAQQDPNPNIPDDYRKTHDFLQPLEEVGKSVEKSKSKSKSSPRIVDHILPGGMGTYSMNHIPYMNNQIQTQKINNQGIVISSGAKSSSSNNNNNDENSNSNSSSYTGSGFTLFEDSNIILNKGKTRKENVVGINKHMIKDGGGVPWMTSSIHNCPTTTFTSLSSAPNNRYFADTLKFGKSPQKELDDDDDQLFVIKKEPTFHHKAVKIDSGQKPNSPRSKHSATEQRRRSKINDRFSMLRGIIPHGDQKRDKASFLLEVIEYIQFLQDKVHKYEDSGQGWTNQPPNNISSNYKKPSNDFRNEPMSSLDATNQHISTADTITDCTITSDKLKLDEQLMIESGTISISTTYSQGLSSALTQALKSSGVDLSHISVQIDLGKGSNNSDLKENETVSVDQSSGEGFKRLKTNRKMV